MHWYDMPQLLFLNLGFGEIVGIALIVLLLFGAKRIPEVMRSLGEGIREFKKASAEATSDLRRAVEDSEPADTEKKKGQG